MTQSAPAAFFSYSREDSDFALRLAGDLKAAGASVWLDQLDIIPGQRWDRAVEDALARCPRMLIILSPASVDSTNVMDEVSFALEEKKTVIPIICKDCVVPFRLRRVQYVDFRKDYARGLKELLKTLNPQQSTPAISDAPRQTDSTVADKGERAAQEERREAVEAQTRASEQARVNQEREQAAKQERLELTRLDVNPPPIKVLGYEVHLAGYGWKQGIVYDGMGTGTTGHAIAIEAFKVYGMPPGMQVRAHVAGKGWLPWVGNGQVAGTTREARRLEALQFQFEGQAPVPMIGGRAHCAGIGWQPYDFAMTPKFFGTVGQRRQMEAIQMCLFAPMLKLEEFDLGKMRPLFRDTRSDPPFTAMPNGWESVKSAMKGVACIASVGFAGAICVETAGLTCALEGMLTASACTDLADAGKQFVWAGGRGTDDRDLPGDDGALTAENQAQPPSRPAAEVVPTRAHRRTVIDVSQTSSEYKTIMAAVRAASEGDCVQVEAGHYREHLHLDKPVEIIGAGDRDNVIVEYQNDNVISFSAAHGRISNLTIRHTGSEYSAVKITKGRLVLEECDLTSRGLSCVSIQYEADPTVRRNRIHGGRQEGVYAGDGASGLIEDNEIFENGLAGVAIWRGAAPTIRGNEIYGCKEGVYIGDRGRGVIEKNRIHHNRGPAIKTEGGEPTILSNEEFQNTVAGL